MSKLGDKIKEIRTSNNLTLQEFADSLGYTSSSTINKIEKGINDIAFNKLVKLCRLYTIDINEFSDQMTQLKKQMEQLTINFPNFETFKTVSTNSLLYSNLKLSK